MKSCAPEGVPPRSVNGALNDSLWRSHTKPAALKEDPRKGDLSVAWQGQRNIDRTLGFTKAIIGRAFGASHQG